MALKKVIIIGGGLSGLINAIVLARAGISVTLFEKKNYPLHRVCGEYISNETVPFLKKLDLFPEVFDPPIIKRLQLTSLSGQSAFLPLTVGGFGISRYSFDYFLYKRAVADGVQFILDTEAEKILFRDDQFEVLAGGNTFLSDIVIGTFGKRSRLDVNLGRSFVKKRSPWIGVKYHIITNHDNDLIGLHNFKNGYCGISNVEAGKTNLCYLSHRDNLKLHGNIATMEKEVLHQNPFLKRFLPLLNSSGKSQKPSTKFLSKPKSLWKIIF